MRPHANMSLIIVWMYPRCSESQIIREAGKGELKGNKQMCLIGAKRREKAHKQRRAPKARVNNSLFRLYRVVPLIPLDSLPSHRRV